MATLDLDAQARARIGAGREPSIIVFRGVEFELPSELPWEIADALAEMSKAKGDKGASEPIRRMAALLFDGRAEEFWALRPSAGDIVAILDGIDDLYGSGTPGESEASGSSSKSVGKSSRPRSRKPTA